MFKTIPAWICIVIHVLISWSVDAARSSIHLQERYTTLNVDLLHYFANLSDGAQLEPRPPIGTSTHLSEILIKRIPGSVNNTRVRKYISKQFQDLGWHVEEDAFEDTTPLGPYPFTNLVVTADPTASKKLVLAAHFDSHWFPDNVQFLGATDSAVPCAILIDLAQALSKDLVAARKLLQDGETNVDELDFDGDDDICTQDTTLQLIFFDGEEDFKGWTKQDSIYGSRHLAQKWQNEFVSSSDGFCIKQATNKLDSIEMFILLDLLGAREPSVSASSYETTWAFQALIDLEGRLAAQGLWEPMDPLQPSIDAPGQANSKSKSVSYRSFFRTLPKHGLLASGIEDDHIPFMERGVPVLHVIPFPFPPVWHKVTDNADAVHLPTARNWNLLIRIFVAEYFGLRSDRARATAKSQPQFYPVRDLVGVA